MKLRPIIYTFRHTLATVMKDNSEDVKVVQEALRHANSRITLDTILRQSHEPNGKRSRKLCE
jgi:integrase